MGAGSTGCGYLLYPERRGTLSGTIDSGTMVMDLLWLLPGIIPGVVALIVDFSSGAIYVRGKTAIRLPANGKLAVRLPAVERPVRLEFQVVTGSARVLARKVALLGPTDGRHPAAHSLDLPFSDDRPMRHSGGGGPGVDAEEVHLEVRRDGGSWSRFPTAMVLSDGI